MYGTAQNSKPLSRNCSNKREKDNFQFLYLQPLLASTNSNKETNLHKKARTSDNITVLGISHEWHAQNQLRLHVNHI